MLPKISHEEVESGPEGDGRMKRSRYTEEQIIGILKEQEAGDIVVVVGGTIPHDDIPQLKELGVAEVFTPGAATQEIVDFLRTTVSID